MRGNGQSGSDEGGANGSQFMDSAKNVLSKYWPVLIPMLGLLALLWVFRPWFQPIWYGIRFKWVGTIIYLFLTLGAFGLLKVAMKQNRKGVATVLGIVTILLAVITLGSPIIADMYTNEDMAGDTNMNTMVINSTQNATEIDQSNARIMTLTGAETQADTSFNEPTHVLSDGELVMRNGQLTTSYAVEPEGLYKSFTRNQKGAVFVNINTNQPSVEQVDQTFKCGRGMLVFDDVKFKMQKDHMNTVLTNPTTFQGNDGNLYNMYSGVQHELRLSFDNGIPMVHAVPEYTGVYLSDTDCNQEHLSPEEAINDSRMDGENKQQFYPYGLMKKEVMATNYQYGIINTFTDREGMKELPRTPSIDNSPPYTLISENGKYTQVLTMEAIGGGTGVFEVYVGDGRTGEKTKYTFNTTKKGPGYAVDATITANSERFGEGGDKLTISEVYPVFRDGELWYQVNAVQKGTGVYGFTAFFNPDTETLLKAYTDDQIEAFYEGSDRTNEQPENIVDAGESSSDGRTVDNPTLWVVIEDDETGETYTVPVGSGENVQVSQEEPDDNNDNSTDTSN